MARNNGQTDGQTDGQGDYYRAPPTSSGGALMKEIVLISTILDTVCKESLTTYSF